MDALVEVKRADLSNGAIEACTLLKTLSHKDRFLILCELMGGEKSVGQLGEILSLPQSPLSQHLARMRKEGLVKTRRESQSIFYSLASKKASMLIETVYHMYCLPEAEIIDNNQPNKF